jgi:acyl carrier protein
MGFPGTSGEDQLLVNTDSGFSAAAGADAPLNPPGQAASATETEIRGFLADIFFLGDDPANLPGSKSLIVAGVIDSTGVLELVGFLEEQYKIRIEDDELLPENLDSVNNIVDFVSRKQAAA